MPQLVVVILPAAQACDAVVQAWAELGVTGVTILEGTGMLQTMRDHASRDDLPLMPSLRTVLESGEVQQRTLFTVVPDDFDLDALLARTEERVGDLESSDSGMLFVVPVTRVLGLGQHTTSESLPGEAHAHRRLHENRRDLAEPRSHRARSGRPDG